MSKKGAFIEERRVLQVSCGRERKFADESFALRGIQLTDDDRAVLASKRRCHIGLTEMHPGVCGCCVWYEVEKVGDGLGKALIMDRQISVDEIESLRIEYREKNGKATGMPIIDGKSIFRKIGDD